MTDKIYAAIDLKSFYASVECMERGLDPMTTNLVVADESRTEKTICLAVSPSLKSYGIPGRVRLFEVIQKVKEINMIRKSRAPGRAFSGESYHDPDVKKDPSLSLGYIVAPPRMAYYMEYSARIYQIYLRFVAPEDIIVYSIDEVFMDITGYLHHGTETPRDFVKKVLQTVLKETGIPAAAGIGTNLYLAKIAMDITAKRLPAEKDGVRIAELDEKRYRRQLWAHRPLTDFWRVGRVYAAKLEAHGIYTMGDIARCSMINEELLYKLFGINAELLIDHAWGWEPCTVADVKAYQPESSSLGSGQVLRAPYPFDKAKLVLREMTEALVLDLTDKALVTNKLTITIGYDTENLARPEIQKQYKGPTTKDRYGRETPKPSHGTINLKKPSASARLIIDAALDLFDRIADPALLIRRLNITAEGVVRERNVENKEAPEQLDLFTDYDALERERQAEEERLKRERKIQEALLAVKKKFGRNAIYKATSLEDGSTAIERNGQIGGHKA